MRLEAEVDSAGKRHGPGSETLPAGDLIGVLSLCLIAGWLLWTKLPDLSFRDPAWWLQETFRFAQGQVPYRDYFWPYPPLALLIFGGALRVAGAKFWVAQVLLDAFSLAVMLGIYFWSRRLLPRRLHVLNCVLVLAVCATTQTYFSLFSFLTYGPALQVSATGLLLLWLGVVRYLGGPRLTAGTAAAMAIGAGIALTSKQETILSVFAIFGLLLIGDRHLRFQSVSAGIWMAHYARMATLWFVPSSCLYLAVGRWTGFGRMFLGIQGNGIASMICPWWPTGFGLFAAAGALGLAALVAGACTLADAPRWKAYLGGRRYALLILASLAGGAIYGALVAFNYPDALFGPYALREKLARLAPELLSTTAVFRPALWAMIVYWLYLLVRFLRSGCRSSPEGIGVMLAFAIPVSLGVRSLFGSHLSPYPEVPAICYPFVVVLTPYLLLRWLRLPYRFQDELGLRIPAVPARVTAALMLAYIAVRVFGGYPEVLSQRQFTRLDTPAGSVHVRNGDVNRAILNYVLEHTSPSDPILELPYGGGASFATGRPSYSFTTLWRQGIVPEDIQELDLKKLRERPPKVIVALSAENFGSYYGLMGHNACVLPAIVWMPNRISWRPGYVYPAIRWIQENYRVDRRVGEWLLLQRL